MTTANARPIVAFGPKMPGWGSWEWIGLDTAQELSKYYVTRTFDWSAIPPADVYVIIKHLPCGAFLENLAARAPVIYCPVDFFGDLAHISELSPALERCALIVVHCERLRTYFESMCPVAYLDHHVKYVTHQHRTYTKEGHSLWTGARSNLEPLVQWLNRHALKLPLRILTNLENPQRPCTPADIGISHHNQVVVENWTPRRHLEAAQTAIGALDIKGDDFRSAHKPPAKAFDFIASGLPLAMNSDSSSVEHLASLGFEVANPLDVNTWLGRDYWEETQRFGTAVRELLSIERVGRRWKRLIDDILR